MGDAVGYDTLTPLPEESTPLFDLFKTGDTLVLKLRHDPTLEYEPCLGGIKGKYVGNGVRNVVMDMEHAPHLYEEAMGVLMRCYTAFNKPPEDKPHHPVEFRLFNLTGKELDALAITRLHDPLTPYAGMAAALDGNGSGKIKIEDRHKRSPPPAVYYG